MEQPNTPPSSDTPKVTFTAGKAADFDAFEGYDDDAQVQSQTPPPEVAKPKEPEKPTHPAALVRLAQRFGIPQHRIDNSTTDHLEELIEIAEIAAFRRHEPQPEPKPVAKVEEEPDYEPELSDDYGPELKKEFKRLHAHAREKAEKAAAKKAAELESQLAELKAGAQRSAEAAVHAQLEQLYRANKSIYGDKPNSQVKPGTPEFRKRVAVYDALVRLQQSGQATTLDSDFAMIHDELFGTTEPEKETPKANGKPSALDAWNRGSLARPNGSAAAKGPGKTRAEKAKNLQSILDAKGLDRDGPALDEEEIEFPE